MRYIHTLSLSPAVQDWLANSYHPHILHVFDRVCNLINEHRDVLSIVTPEIGNGPFNLVIESDLLFSKHLNFHSPISLHPNQLNLGNLIINIADANLWSSRPNWEMLHDKRVVILDQLTKLPITNYRFSSSLISNLSHALANADTSSCLNVAQQLAGLGAGLTPAGDDFLLGGIYATWILHPSEIAAVLTQEIAKIAAPLTTSLSAAYLKAGSRGEAAAAWHDFFNALSVDDPSAIELHIAKILSIGHTSGADAFAGFLGCMSVSQ